MPPTAEGFAARLVLGPALRAQPDRRLVTLVRDGYESAFEEIVRRYGRQLTRYAAAIAGSRGEDVTQDAFSKALLALRRNDAEIELRPWLFRIVRNTALNDLRDSPLTLELPAEAIAGGESPAEVLERREELTDLMRRLRALPEAQRAAIVMREMEGLSHDEIAAALGVSPGGARQAIHRARRALRDGTGMLVPLPLLKALLAAGSMGTAEVAAGAGGTVGAGVALKAVTASLLVAGAVGAGVAIHDGPHAVGRPQQAAVTSRAPRAIPSRSIIATAPTVGDERSEHERGEDGGRGKGDRGRDRGRGKDEDGDDRGGLRGGPGGESDNSGPGPEGDHESRGDTDRHGDTGGPGRGSEDDPSGAVGDSGGGSGDSGGRDSSGSGSNGESSAYGGSSSSGSGGGDLSDDLSGGGPGPSVTQAPTETTDESGSGGGDGGSGDGSSSSGGSSGSGSGDYLSVD